MKKRTILLFSLAALLISCNSKKETVYWDYLDEDIEDAVRLNAYAEIDEHLIINISSESSFFKDKILQEEIVLAPKVKEGTEEGKVTFKDILDNRITDFTYIQNGDKEISITLDEYNPTSYFVFFEKSASKDNVLSYASIFTYKENIKATPTFMGEKQKYYGGASSPKFVINFDNAFIDNPNLISFYGAFKNLEVSKVNVNDNSVEIETDGIIEHSNKGTITLNEGFFKDVDYDVNFYQDVCLSFTYLDQSTFKYTNGEFIFNVTTIEKEFADSLKKENIVIDESLESISLKSVVRRNDTTATITLLINDNNLNTLEKVLEYVDGMVIGFKNALKDIVLDFDLDFSIDYPSLVLFPSFDYQNKEFNLIGKAYNLNEVTFNQDEVAFTDSNIKLNENLSIKEFSSINNGFIIKGNVLNEVDHFYGKIEFLEDKVQTQWGKNYALSSYFDCTAITLNLGDENKIIDKVLNNPIVLDDGLKGVSLDDSLSAFNFNVGIGEFGPALTSLTEFLKISKITYPSIGSSFDYFGNYKTMYEDNTYSEFQNIDEFGDEITNDDMGNMYNADRSLYKERQDRWDAFYHKYVAKMQEMIRQYQEKYYAKLIELQKGGPYSYRAVTLDDWCSDDNNYGASIMNPEEPYFSIEDYDIDDMEEVNFYGWVFSAGLEEFNKSHEYTIEVERLLKSSIGSHVNIGGFTQDMVYATVQAYIFTQIATKEDAAAFNDLYLAFANEIGQEYEKSILTDYYDNITSYYNFQSEINNKLRMFLTDMKLKLELFGSFSQILNLFSLSKIDYKTISETVKNADNAITNYDYLKELKSDENYAYAINNKVKSSLINMVYETHYDDNGTLNAQFDIYDAYTNEPINEINNNALVNQDDFSVIYNRFNILKEMGIETAPDFLTYLLKYKIFGVDPVERYQNFRYQSALDKGEVLMDIPLPILTSFNGAFNINQGDNYKCYCATSYDGNGEYYRDDNDYFYGSSGDNLMGSKRNWEGKEARGTILDVRDMSSNETVLSAIATYNESFWNNAHDEIHTFNKYEHGFYCFALYRI